MGKTNKKKHYQSDAKEDASKQKKASKKEKDVDFEDLEPWDETTGDQDDTDLDPYRDDEDSDLE